MVTITAGQGRDSLIYNHQFQNNHNETCIGIWNLKGPLLILILILISRYLAHYIMFIITTQSRGDLTMLLLVMIGKILYRWFFVARLLMVYSALVLVPVR